ncbi:MAG TPA: hypothetical protein VHI13_02715 [Candidatus Kapabacteria bacterium]|nr:hypothetical protein [Candidatus Kapabacteria bacterium]
MRLRWSDLGGISGEVWEAVEQKFQEHYKVEDADSGIPGNENAVQLHMMVPYERIAARLSFIFKIFKFLGQLKVTNGSYKDFSIYRQSKWQDRLVLNTLAGNDGKPANDLLSQYSEALSIFEQEIDCKDFRYDILSDRAFRIHSGLFVLHVSPYYSTEVELYALQRDPLLAVGKFLTAAGKTEAALPRHVRSLDEYVLGGYFGMLYAGGPAPIEQEDGRDLFSKPIQEYRARRYDNCVRALGVIVELYLRQIYETVIRKPVPPAFGMGNIFQAVSNWPRQDANVASLRNRSGSLVSRIDKFHSEVKRRGIAVQEKESMHALIADAGTMLCELREVLLGKQSTPYGSDKSFFGPEVKNGLEHLIKLRNVAAHRSAVILDEKEIQKAAFGCYQFLEWWRTKRGSYQPPTEPRREQQAMPPKN